MAGTAAARKATRGTSAAGRKPTTRQKAAAARKPAARGKTPSGKGTPDLATRARDAGRNAFLASLGFYAKVFDQAQEQFSSIEDQLEARRQKADKLYQELVERGLQVEKDARVALKDIDLPRLELDGLADRKKLEAQLKKARARFVELKESVGLKATA